MMFNVYIAFKLHSYKVCHTHIYTNQSDETTLCILYVCLFFLKKKLLVHWLYIISTVSATIVKGTAVRGTATIVVRCSVKNRKL